VFGGYPGRAVETSAEDMLDVFRTNVIGPLLVNQAIVPLLNKRDPSNPPMVVNMTSYMGSLAANKESGSTAYRCSKAAVNMMNVNFAREVPDVVWVAMHPGWVDTDMGRTTGGSPPLKADQSAAAIMKTLSQIKKSDSGCFIGYNGRKIPF
jgi:NAD(P)-dependent dehydrogenase (short-subunit alcohol dehydrogenase family)